MSRTPDPQLSFADLELSRTGRPSRPRPATHWLIPRSATPIWSSKSAWIWSAASRTPAPGAAVSPPRRPLRSLTRMRIKNWDYRELRERINDGYTLRGFTQFDTQLVPKHDAFNRAFNRLTPATLEAINQKP